MRIRPRPVRFTKRELEAILEAVHLRLADDKDEDVDVEALDSAADKVIVLLRREEVTR